MFITLLCTLEEENEAKKFKSTLTHGGTKHKQVFASLAIVRGAILPFNNKRTWKTDNLSIWRNLLDIIKTDQKVKEFLEELISGELSCIIVKNVVEGGNDIMRPYKPLKRRLFSSVAPQALCTNDISYDLD